MALFLREILNSAKAKPKEPPPRVNHIRAEVMSNIFHFSNKIFLIKGELSFKVLLSNPRFGQKKTVLLDLWDEIEMLSSRWFLRRFVDPTMEFL